MKISTVTLGLVMGSAAIALLAACNGGSVVQPEARPAVFLPDQPVAAISIQAMSVSEREPLQPRTPIEVDLPLFKTETAPAIEAVGYYPALDEVGVSNTERPAPRQRQLTSLWTKLRPEIQAANLRTGPGLEFEVLAVIDQQQGLIVTGRVIDSAWVKVSSGGQNGWLWGELMQRQRLFDLLPTVEYQAELVIEPEPELAPSRLVGTVCQAHPIRGFGQTWNNHMEVRAWLGCPFTDFRQGEHATAAAVQSFEHGWMLWLETDTVANVDPIYVFFEDDRSYIRYGDRQLVDAHSYAPTPTGFNKVGDRFAKVYWEEIGVQARRRLGNAINEARDSQGAFQEFEYGRMFWAGEADTIYVIYQNYLDPDGDGSYTRTQGWMSYEDTYEELTQK